MNKPTVTKSIVNPVAIARALRPYGYVGSDRDISHMVAHCSATARGTLRPLLGSSTKIAKAGSVGALGTVLYLAPARQFLGAKGKSLCPNAGACAESCLTGSGRMIQANAVASRAFKTARLLLDREGFLATLHAEAALHGAQARALGLEPVLRLNGTSDVPFERLGFVAPPGVVWYDYTKLPLASRDLANGYHLTFSIDERPESLTEAQRYLDAGLSAAIVLQADAYKDAIAKGMTLNGRPIVDGDKHDVRPYDEPGSVVVLRLKGRRIEQDAAIASGFARTYLPSSL